MGHEHDGEDDVQEHRAHDAPLSDVELRVRTLESLLVDNGLVDPAYKRRLLEDGTAAVAEFGFVGRQSEKLVVVENTPAVHNVVVCTLCSCYPWAVLGLPPVWYKSAPYRARAVIDPRGVLKQPGVEG